MIVVTEFKLEYYRAEQAESTGMYHIAVQNYLHCFSSVKSLNDAEMMSIFASALARCYTKMNMLDKAAFYAGFCFVSA